MGPVRSELTKELLAACVDRREWPQSLHWDWSKKAPELRLLESSGFGVVLFWRAILQSLDEGFKGRVGLHSLPKAENFYRKCGMVEVGYDAAKQGLMYFELTQEGAEKFLTDGGYQ